MPAAEKLKELAERKTLLVAQADLHRALLRAEVAELQDRLSWLEQGPPKFASSPWAWAGTAVAGLFAARNLRLAMKWIPAALAAWRWIQKLRA